MLSIMCVYDILTLPGQTWKERSVQPEYRDID
jgi:hypothetical protein